MKRINKKIISYKDKKMCENAVRAKQFEKKGINKPLAPKKAPVVVPKKTLEGA